MIFQYLRLFGKMSEAVASILLVDKSSVLIIWRSLDGKQKSLLPSPSSYFTD